MHHPLQNKETEGKLASPKNDEENHLPEGFTDCAAFSMITNALSHVGFHHFHDDDENYTDVSKLTNVSGPKKSTNEFNLDDVENKKHGHHHEDEIDYSTIFETPELGFDIHPGHHHHNGIIGDLTTQFARHHLFPGSLICAVNDEWLIGKTTLDIRRIILEHTAKLPFTLRLRCKRWMCQNLRSGTLLVQVVTADALSHAATHASVRINDALLTTNIKSKSHGPIIWSDILSWRHYKPSLTNKATIRIWKHNNILRNTCVGRVVFDLPHGFETMKTEVLTLLDSHGKVSGIVEVRAIIVRHGIKRSSFMNQNLN